MIIKLYSYRLWDNFYSLSIFTYLASGSVGLYFNNTFLSAFAALIGLFYLVYIFVEILQKGLPNNYSFNVLTTFFIFYVLGIILSNIYHEKFDNGFFLYAITSVSMSYILISKKISSKAISLPLWILVAYFLFLMITGVNPNFALGESFSSRNGVSVILINITVLYILIDYKNKKIPSIILPLFVFLICVWTLSRAGIVCSFIVLFASFLLRFKSKKTISEKFKFFFKSVLAFLLPILINLKFLINEITPLIEASIGRGFSFTADERADFLNFYIDNMDMNYLLFGLYLKGTGLFSENSNAHNSFIQLHSLTGIFGLLAIFLIFYLLLTTLKKNFAIGLLSIALILRGLTDTIYFFDIFDFILISSLILMSINHKYRYID
jgi:hypothetical protein